MNNNNTNRSTFKNEDFLLKSFSDFLSLNPDLSIADALIEFDRSFHRLATALYKDAQLTERVMSQVFANL